MLRTFPHGAHQAQRQQSSTNRYKTKQKERSFINKLQIVVRFQSQRETIQQGAREFTGKVTLPCGREKGTMCVPGRIRIYHGCGDRKSPASVTQKETVENQAGIWNTIVRGLHGRASEDDAVVTRATQMKINPVVAEQTGKWWDAVGRPERKYHIC